VTSWIQRLIRRPVPPPPERCDCPCHGDLAIAHVAPCCAACRHCGVRFSAGLEAHERTCDARPA